MMANRSTKVRAVATIGFGVDTEALDWDRIRQRYASPRSRSTRLTILSTGIHVRATDPAELEAALVAALEELHKDESMSPRTELASVRKIDRTTVRDARPVAICMRHAIVITRIGAIVITGSRAS
jgi:hypothetical protein